MAIPTATMAQPERRSSGIRALHEGARVSICSRDGDEVRAAGQELGVALAQRADVTDPVQVAEFVARSAETLGGINGVVNNAGRARPGTFATLTDSDW